MGGVEQWVEVPLPANQGPSTIDSVAALARRDLQLIQHVGTGALYGVAADTKANPRSGRALCFFEPDRITEAEYAAAVRRGIEDLRQDDEVHMVEPGQVVPPGARGPIPPG